MQELSDEEIAVRVQEGDSDAFGLLIDRYEAKLERYTRRFLRRPEDVDDMVQEVFVKTYTNIKSFNPTLRFSPWIYRIAHNTCINEIKRQQRGFTHLFDFDTLIPLLAAKETADSATLDREQSEVFERFLGTLDLKYREPLILYYYEDLSYQEISDILQIPITTVGVRIKRAKDKLKLVMENETSDI